MTYPFTNLFVHPDVASVACWCDRAGVCCGTEESPGADEGAGVACCAAGTSASDELGVDTGAVDGGAASITFAAGVLCAGGSGGVGRSLSWSAVSGAGGWSGTKRCSIASSDGLGSAAAGTKFAGCSTDFVSLLWVPFWVAFWAGFASAAAGVAF